jgi:hypothetical protein
LPGTTPRGHPHHPNALDVRITTAPDERGVAGVDGRHRTAGAGDRGATERAAAPDGTALGAACAGAGRAAARQRPGARLIDCDVLTEPLRGWRGWQVVSGRHGPVLASWWVHALWPARRPLEARCGVHGSRPVTHHPCGIHAFSTREEAIAYLDRSQRATPLLFVDRPQRALGLAIGRVSGWGRAVSHARGWRSQFAYPYDLHLLSGDRALARALAGRYAVDVSPVPPEA